MDFHFPQRLFQLKNTSGLLDNMIYLRESWVKDKKITCRCGWGYSLSVSLVGLCYSSSPTGNTWKGLGCVTQPCVRLYPSPFISAAWWLPVSKAQTLQYFSSTVQNMHVLLIYGQPMCRVGCYGQGSVGRIMKLPSHFPDTAQWESHWPSTQNHAS